MHILMTNWDWVIAGGFVVVLVLMILALIKMYPQYKKVQSNGENEKDDKSLRHLFMLGVALMFGFWFFFATRFVTTRMTPKRLANNHVVIKQLTVVDEQISQQQRQLIFEKLMLKNETKPGLVYKYLIRRNTVQKKLTQLQTKRQHLSKQIYRPLTFSQLLQG